MNAYWQSLTFQLPPVPAGHNEQWRRCTDTALAAALAKLQAGDLLTLKVLRSGKVLDLTTEVSE